MNSNYLSLYSWTNIIFANGTFKGVMQYYLCSIYQISLIFFYWMIKKIELNLQHYSINFVLQI